MKKTALSPDLIAARNKYYERNKFFSYVFAMIGIVVIGFIILIYALYYFFKKPDESKTYKNRFALERHQANTCEYYNSQRCESREFIFPSAEFSPIIVTAKL